MKTSSRYALALLSVVAGTLAASPSAQAERMFAIGSSDNVLRSFDSASPATALSVVTISGLGAGEFAAGIDVRPATGELYAVTTADRLYVLNPVTGVATAVGSSAFAPSLTGSVGMDINPVADRVRLVDETGVSMRVNPITGALAFQDPNLNPGTPNVTAVAYSNNFSGATSTTLYDIDTGSDVLATQNPPNNGTLNPVGAGLGIDAGPASGFDIDSDGSAYAVLSVGGVSNLYTINLTGGAATLVGSTGASLDGLAIDSQAPAPVRVDTPSRVVAETSGTTPITLRRTGGSLLANVTVDVTVGDGTATSPGDYVAQATTATFAAGATTATVNVKVLDDDVYEGNEFFQLTLSNPRYSTNDGPQVGSPSTTIIGITDDETAPVNSGPTGPMGLTGLTGPIGPTGAAGRNATSLFVALASARVSIRRRARLRVPYVANAAFPVTAEVLKGKKVLARARQTAKPGRNKLSFAAKKRFKPGRYVLRLTATSGATRSVDLGRLVVRKG
jgi:Domain of unknown function (DUF4394)/Calx-beta domain